MILVVGGAYQGKTAFVRSLGIAEEKVLNGFSYIAEQRVSEGKNLDGLVDEALSGRYAAVISDETGCGIVPIDEKKRLCRELTGRALQKIAAACDEVWLVRCGIPKRIK